MLRKAFLAIIAVAGSLPMVTMAQQPPPPPPAYPPPGYPQQQQQSYPQQQQQGYPQQQQQGYPQQSGYPQQPGYPAQAPPPYGQPPMIAPQQLDQLVQRIALYPDPLLAQVLTASTFSNQIPDAATWVDQPDTHDTTVSAAMVPRLVSTPVTLLPLRLMAVTWV